MATRGKLVNTVAGLGLKKPKANYSLGIGADPKKAAAQGPAAYPAFGAAPAPAAAAQAPAQPAAAQPFTFTPDATYLATMAQSQADRTAKLNEVESQGRVQKQDTEEAIRRLLTKAPEDRRQITAGANKQGLLYGGHHAKQLDEYQTQVTRSESDQRLALQRGDDARAAIRQALLDGVPLEEAAERAAAVERQVGRDSEAASLNMLAAPPATAAPAAAVAAGPAKVNASAAQSAAQKQRARAEAAAAEAEARARARRRNRR